MANHVTCAPQTTATKKQAWHAPQLANLTSLATNGKTVYQTKEGPYSLTRGPS